MNGFLWKQYAIYKLKQCCHNNQCFHHITKPVIIQVISRENVLTPLAVNWTNDQWQHTLTIYNKNISRPNTSSYMFINEAHAYNSVCHTSNQHEKKMVYCNNKNMRYISHVLNTVNLSREEMGWNVKATLGSESPECPRITYTQKKSEEGSQN